MKYYWSIFLWENGAKSTDYSNNLIAPIFYEEKLNEELDTAEVVLDNMDISTRFKFPPKTKFRLELYLDKDDDNPYKKWDMVVEHDDVEAYVGEPDICCHRLFLIEPSVIAQGMHVDNIALTYELQDVTLNYKVVRNPNDVVGVSKFPGGGNRKTYEYYNQYTSASPSEHDRITSFSYEWEDLESLNSLLNEIDGSIAKTISFTLPKLKCYHLNGENKTELFEVPVKCEIYKSIVNNGIIDESTKEQISTYYFNPTSASNRNDNVMYNSNAKVGIRNYDDQSYTYMVPIGGGMGINLFPDNTYSQFPAIINLSNTSQSNRQVEFVTDSISIEQMNANISYRYQIKITANPYQSNSMVTYFDKKAIIGAEYSTVEDWLLWAATLFLGTLQKRKDVNVKTYEVEIAEPSNIYVETVFNCVDLTNDAPPSPFIMKGNKYSCMKLFRKAMLTCDTQIFNNDLIGLDAYDGIQYPIVVDEAWIDRMTSAQCYETVFEEKNLWEVMLQIGYYLHAIPSLSFSEDGTDRFMLSFSQLGDTEKKQDSSNKITIFNSCNLSEYFAQLDSYVTNLFSPQNLIEEWIVPKTEDSSYLISNNTAELHLQYPITELVEFDITYDANQNNNMGTSGTKSALDRVFEKSIYAILSNQYSRNATQRIKPAKGTSLYYELGDNKILGLNYVPPTVNEGDGLMALKDILTDLFQGSDEHWNANEIKFNTLVFHVKYRTQDELRITQMRPDLDKYMKNSEYEKYPQHQQWYGQTDKIVDSERFSANLWGRLIRMGNGIYQCQEYVTDITNMKECGYLINFSDGPYYVTCVENEFYSDGIFQKVTYSKNFNQISQIVAIPSEPRFYEVSERSMVRREIRLADFFLLTTQNKDNVGSPRFINPSKWKDFIKHMLFNTSFEDLPNFAYVKYKADKKRDHTDTSGQIIKAEQMFPSSEIIRNSDNTVEPKGSSDHSEVIVPLLHFPMKNSIVFEWDMDDNFKAGDSVDSSISGGNTTDNSYYSLQPIRYCDILGRADLFNFRLFNKTDWEFSDLQKLPRVDTVPEDSSCLALLPDTLSIGLDKDNREALSFNFQINLLTSVENDDEENFITFPNLFGEKSSQLKMCFLNKTVSMFDESVSLRTNMLRDNIEYSLSETDNAIKLSISVPEDVDKDLVKSIVLYDEDGGIKYAYLAKNVDRQTNSDKFKDWYVYPIFNTD